MVTEDDVWENPLRVTVLTKDDMALAAQYLAVGEKMTTPDVQVTEVDPQTEKWDQLLAPWYGKFPSEKSERLITPWAIGNWTAWNEHAIEVEMALFLARLTFQLGNGSSEDLLVIETGTGQGFLTRALAGGRQEPMLCYESDAEWRNTLHDRKIFPYGMAQLSQAPTPDSYTMSTADLVLLDSMDPFRLAELCLWASVGKSGSFLWVHDAGNGHPSWDGHYTLGQLIRTLKIPGKFLENPRGSFLAQRDSEFLPTWVLELWDKTLEQTGNLVRQSAVEQE